MLTRQWKDHDLSLACSEILLLICSAEQDHLAFSQISVILLLLFIRQLHPVITVTRKGSSVPNELKNICPHSLAVQAIGLYVFLFVFSIFYNVQVFFYNFHLSLSSICYVHLKIYRCFHFPCKPGCISVTSVISF